MIKKFLENFKTTELFDKEEIELMKMAKESLEPDDARMEDDEVVISGDKMESYEMVERLLISSLDFLDKIETTGEFSLRRGDCRVLGDTFVICLDLLMEMCEDGRVCDDNE